MQLDDVHELVLGPMRGYFVAVYACPTNDDREEFAPCFKLFCFKPESYFESEGCLLKGRPPMLTNDVARALFLAIAYAREMIARLPDPEQLEIDKLEWLGNSLPALWAPSGPMGLEGESASVAS